MQYYQKGGAKHMVRVLFNPTLVCKCTDDKGDFVKFGRDMVSFATKDNPEWVNLERAWSGRGKSAGDHFEVQGNGGTCIVRIRNYIKGNCDEGTWASLRDTGKSNAD